MDKEKKCKDGFIEYYIDFGYSKLQFWKGSDIVR